MFHNLEIRRIKYLHSHELYQHFVRDAGEILRAFAKELKDNASEEEVYEGMKSFRKRFAIAVNGIKNPQD